jgi:hypothetical protein
MRWIVGSSLKPRIVMAGLAMVLMIFGYASMGFTRLHHGPVSVLPKFSRPRVESQAEPLGLYAQEVEDLAATLFEVDLLDDEGSCKEKGSWGWVSSKSPNCNPVGRRQVGDEMFIAIQALGSREIPLRI